MYKTDLDILHNVILNELNGRGCGKTTARIHILAGIVEVGSLPLIIVKISKKSDLHYLWPMIKNIFNEHQLPIIKTSKNEFISNNKIIRFVIPEYQHQHCIPSNAEEINISQGD